MKKLAILVVALTPLCAFSQSMLITLKSGEQQRITIADIENLSFIESEEQDPDTPDVPPVSDGVSMNVFTDPYMLEQMTPYDLNGDGVLSNDEIAAIKDLDLHEIVSYDDDGNLIEMPRKKNVEGLQYLTAVEKLNLSSCIELLEVDLSALENLNFLQMGFSNNVKTLKLGNKPNLEEMYVMYCYALENLDLDNVPNLQVASMSETNLANINLSNRKDLTKLTVGSAALESLNIDGCDNIIDLSLLGVKKFNGFDIAPFQNLENFSMTYSKITSYTTEDNPGLRTLYLDNSDNLLSVDVSKSLKLKMLSCMSCWELQQVVITEGMNYDSWGGVYSYQIKEVPRVYPDDIASEILDPNFKAYILEVADTNNDGKISAEEAQALTALNAPNLGINEADLFYFPNLTEIDLSGNNLTEIDLSQQQALESLKLANNKLAKLDVSALGAMKYLDASNNEITNNVRLGGYGYIEVNLSHNKITEQTVYFQSNLEKLDLSHNEIVEADIRDNPKLADMDVSFNQIPEITMWSLKGLVNVKFNDNPFIQLNEANRWPLLETIDCSNTKIATLDLSKTDVLKSVKATGCSDLDTIYIGGNTGAQIEADSHTNIVQGSPE